MRNRIWANLTNIKFQEVYTSECSKWAERAGRSISFIIAFASATSIAAWSLWDNMHMAWAIIVAISQLLHVSKPYIPFIKNDRKFMEMSFEYGALYLELEKLWYKFENKKIDHDNAENSFYELRQKELKISQIFNDIHCPQPKWLINTTLEKTNSSLNIYFSQGEQ